MLCDALLDTAVIPMRSHSMGEWAITKEPTCTLKGERVRLCLNTDETAEYIACSYSETEEIPALGHSFGEWFVVYASTYTQKGVERRNCIRCDAYETRELPLLEKEEEDDKDDCDWGFLGELFNFFIEFFMKFFSISC